MNYKTHLQLKKLETELAPLQAQIVSHSLYKKVNSVEALHIFMESHAFAVFDFMSLLKALQIELTQTTLPWIPKGNPNTRRFINEIVLGEESDVDREGNPMSHYEMYLEAMEECGANTTKMNQFVALLSEGKPYQEALKAVDASQAVQDFVNFTFTTVATKEAHKIAAVFTFGREDLIPNMFIQMVKDIDQSMHVSLDKFIYYLERHIELDGDEHGPLALQMIQELCGEDDQKWEDCIALSKAALQQRIALWDAIENRIKQRHATTFLV